jgi:hypothetical protein
MTRAIGLERQTTSKEKHFLIGVALTWTPFLIYILSLGDFSSHPAGWSGVASTIVYGIPPLGIGVCLGAEVLGLRLLILGFTRGDLLHHFLFFVTLCSNVFLVVLFGILFAVCLLALLHVQPGLATWLPA